MLLACDPELRAATREAVEQAELSIKYEGYIRRQEEEAEKLKRYEEMRFQPTFPFETVPGLSTEVRDKLVRIRPDSIGQAQRIPGVTPAAVALGLVGVRRGADQEYGHVGGRQQGKARRSMTLSVRRGTCE